eukprot:4834809-Alexandrium_andersonii.AAC.2
MCGVSLFFKDNRKLYKQAFSLCSGTVCTMRMCRNVVLEVGPGCPKATCVLWPTIAAICARHRSTLTDHQASDGARQSILAVLGEMEIEKADTDSGLITPPAHWDRSRHSREPSPERAMVDTEAV